MPSEGPDPRLDPTLAEQVEAWIAADPDPATAAETATLLRAARGGGPAAAAARAALTDGFASPLEFGTAGLRGQLGAGPGRMNRAVVIRTTAGLCRYLQERTPTGDPPGVVVGYDARHGSAQFATDAAAVVAAAGGRARVLPDPLPTPVLAFAVRHLGADAGVMITASHNPAVDNGYKVYLGGRVESGAGRGAQLAPPADAEVAARIAAAGPAAAVPRAAEGWETLTDDIVEAYLARVALPARRHPLRIVLTALHGVGSDLATRALRASGFDDINPVAEQAAPDPDFPTVVYPNPEEPGALDAALETARRVRADLVLALDPDADRCAVAIPVSGAEGWRALTGDEVGALLGEQAAIAASRSSGAYATAPVLASSVVSSRALAAIAARHGIAHATTLTGFKWIARVPGLVFGYEEALGYCVQPEVVRDKDGVATAVRVAALAAELAEHGRGLADGLAELWDRIGLHATTQISIRMTSTPQVAALMARLRAAPPAELAGSPITRLHDLGPGWADLPPTDALVLETGDGDRVVVRPSGTEPKLKCYLEVVAAPGGADDAAPGGANNAAARARLDRLRSEVAGLFGG